MANIPDDFLKSIAENVIAGFLAQFGIVPSVGGMEVTDCGPHRLFTVQSKVSSNPEEICLDSCDMLRSLSVYLERHNTVPTAVRFQPYDFKLYVCCTGVYCFTSIYHTA